MSFTAFPKRNIAEWMLLVAALAETLCATYVLRHPEWSAINAVIYFLAGLTVACTLLFLQPLKTLAVNKRQPHVPAWLYYLMAATLVGFAFYKTQYWIGTTPLSPEYADMLPIIKVMNERLLAGEVQQVYQPIPGIWGGIQPVYYPAMWLPYGVAVAFNFDLRWVNSAALLISFLLCLRWAMRAKRPASFLTFLLCTALLFLWLYTDPSHNYIRLTEEGVVVLYHLLFLRALASQRAVWIGITLALCLLSRYSIVGLIPAATLYLLVQKQFRLLIQAGAACATVVFLLLLLPFGWRVVLLLNGHHTQYIQHIGNVWNSYPQFFTDYLGFARFFVPHHNAALHHTLLVVSFAVPLLLSVMICFVQRRKSLHNVLPCLAKCSLVVFYNFVDVPYLYLFYTSALFSLALLGLHLGGAEENEPLSTTSA